MVFEPIINTILSLDYNPKFIKREYAFTQYDKAYNISKANFAAFYREPFSSDTCCIGAFDSFGINVPEYVNFLGAPRLISHYEGTFFLHELTQDGYKSASFNEPEDAVSHIISNRDRWSAEALIRLKNTDLKPDNTMPDLFDFGLPLEIDKIIEKKLATLITSIVSNEIFKVTEANSESAIKLMFNFIVAKYIIDYNDMAPPLSFLDVIKFFPSNSEVIVGEARANAMLSQSIWDHLVGGFSFKNISPKHLSHIYENTLISDDLRRELSVHATPYRLTNIVVNSLPDRLFKKEGLRIFEPFCGYAPFLMASANRINNNNANSDIKAEKYQVFGTDIDGFAIELAKYGLFLENYPYERDFQFYQMNALLDPMFIQLCNRADLVFCNPPYESIRVDDLTLGSKANWAIMKVLEADPEAVGFVLPKSFTSGKNNREILRAIGEKYNHIEITVLPDGVFSYSDISPAIIVAWKDPEKVDKMVVRREVFKDSYDNFIATGIASSMSSTIYTAAEIYPYWIDPLLARIQEQTKGCAKLGDITASYRGLKWKKGYLSSSEYREDGFVAGTLNVQSGWQMYFNETKTYLNINRDAQYYRTLFENIEWGSQKILVNAHPLGRGIRRVKASIDHAGSYYGQAFHVILTPNRLTLYVIAAMLNNPIADVQFSLNGSKTDNNLYVLRELPVPPLTELDEQNVANAVYKLMEISRNIGKDGFSLMSVQEAKRLVHYIDATILLSYELSDDLYLTILESYISNSRNILSKKEMNNLHRQVSKKFYNLSLTLDDIKVGAYIEWLNFAESKQISIRQSMYEYKNVNVKYDESVYL